MKQPLLRCLALLLGLLLLLAPAHAQVLPGTFAAGGYHSLSIHADGTLWATGFNNSGQLGLPLSTPGTRSWVQVGTANDWLQVAAGEYHSLGLRANGTLYAWGSNLNGQLGIATNSGTNTPVATPTQVGTQVYRQIASNGGYSLGVRADGTLYAWGSNLNGQLGIATNSGTNSPNPLPTRVGSDVYKQVVAGPAHALGLRADGALYAWGINDYGQLGNTINTGTRLPNATPTRVGTALYTQVAAGFYHSLGLRTDGTLYAWGSNANGQLGSTNNVEVFIPNPTPTQVGTDRYSLIAAGENYSLGLRADGTLYAWGLNLDGQLGNPVSVRIPIPTRVGTGLYVQIAAGARHGLGLRADGSLWAWGDSQYGQLGDGSAINSASYPTPTPAATGTALPTRSTASGFSHSLAVRADGTLWAWGENTYGQLGDGTTTWRTAPVQVGTDRNWVMVAAGSDHSLALKADGTLWAWGRNYYGQLGTTTNNNTDGANFLPTQVGPDLYTQVSAGLAHSLALRADGTLWAWGRNYYGQLGTTTNARTNTPNPTPTRVGTDLYTQVSAGFNHSLGLRPNGTLWAWGDNSTSQLGSPLNYSGNPTPAQIGTDLYAQVAAGYSHSLGLRADGTLYAWGYSYGGQLGTGTPTADPIPTPTRVGTGLYKQMVASYNYSLGLRADGTIWGWGATSSGALGIGTANGGATPTQEITSGTSWATLAPGAAGRASLVRTASGLTFASAGLNYSGQLGDGTTTDANRFDRLRPLGTAQPLPVLAASLTSPGLGLYPNPAPGRATALHGAAPGAAVLVLDALGRQVLTITADATGTARLHLPATLAPGVYLVRTGRQVLRLSVE